MNERNRHRRLVITAAGLAMSGALMVACGHARGERAMNTTADSVATDSAMPTPSTANGAATSTSAATPVNPSDNAASSANAGGNASASVSTAPATTERHRASRSADYSASAVPSDNPTTSTGATTTRRHRRAAAETSATEPASTTSPTTSPNGAESNGGLTVSGANALPVGATCSPATGVVAISTQPSMDVSATAQTDATSAKPLSGDVTVSKPVPSDRADTATPPGSQPYDVNRTTSANSQTKPTPDTTGGSLGARDTSKIASGFGTMSVRASEPNPSSMIPSAGVSANASVNSGVAATSESGSLSPCGWPVGAKGSFLNDAQIAHAVLTANATDSVISGAILTRTQNAAVRDFAQMMVREHTDANHQVASIIDRTRIAPAENDISTSILRDTTGHTFASTALSTQVMGQTVTPVTQPASVSTSYSAPKPNAYDYNSPSSATATVAAAPSSATATCSNGMAGMSMTTTATATPNSANPSATSTATVTTPSASATTGCTTASTTAAATPLTGDDKNYIDYMVQSHQGLLDALNNRLIPFAWNPELKSGLEAMKPVVQRHLDRAREIQRGQTASNY